MNQSYSKHSIQLMTFVSAFSTTLAIIMMGGCASAPPQVLSVKSEPAEANVCIKGKFGSKLFSQEQQCIGQTPYESDQIELTDKDGKKHTIHFNDLEKESFYVILKRKGYSSESAVVPSWDHFMVLKPEPTEAVQPAISAPVLPANKTGIVKITSEPIGALVFINDTLRGNTPFAYEGSAGMAKVKIEYPDRQSYESIMTITSGDSRELNIKLLPNHREEAIAAKSSVRIDSVPAGALLYVDDSVKGNAPYVHAGLSGETVRVRLEMNGYDPIEKLVKLGDAGKEMNVVLQMKEKMNPTSSLTQAATIATPIAAAAISPATASLEKSQTPAQEEAIEESSDDAASSEVAARK